MANDNSLQILLDNIWSMDDKEFENLYYQLNSNDKEIIDSRIKNLINDFLSFDSNKVDYEHTTLVKINHRLVLAGIVSQQ